MEIRCAITMYTVIQCTLRVQCTMRIVQCTRSQTSQREFHAFDLFCTSSFSWFQKRLASSLSISSFLSFLFPATPIALGSFKSGNVVAVYLLTLGGPPVLRGIRTTAIWMTNSPEWTSQVRIRAMMWSWKLLFFF